MVAETISILNLDELILQKWWFSKIYEMRLQSLDSKIKVCGK